MATLRPCEERDSKGQTIGLNPSITFKSDPFIRQIRGRTDFSMIDNPQYHPPITAQVQGEKILFFLGTPETPQSRAHAKEVTQAKVKELAPYVIEQLSKCPIRVTQKRPMIYEVRVATIDDMDQVQTVEHDMSGQSSVTLAPVDPIPETVREAGKASRGGRPIQAPIEVTP